MVSKVDIHSKVDEALFGFECGVRSGTGHVDSVVKQVAAFVVNLVDICAELNESFDFIVLTSDKRILGSKLAIKIHLLNVSAKT